MDHEGTSRGPVEPPELPPRAPASSAGFVAGMLAGIAVAAVGAQLWMARHLEPMRIWADEGATYRNLTRLAVSSTWRYGVPAACAAALVALLALRVRRPLAYGVVASAAVVLLALTYIWATAPLTQLADRIRGD